MERIGGGNRRLGNIGTDVTEGDVEVGIVVEVGKGEDVVVVEWGRRGSYESGFGDSDFHFGRSEWVLDGLDGRVWSFLTMVVGRVSVHS